MPFDENLRPDIRSVLQAAALLDVTEHELFRLAHVRWHGVEIDEPTLEKHFVAYMFGDVVPPWVRHFARTVEQLHQAGRLDRHALGIAWVPSSRDMVSKGMRYGVLAGVIVVALVVLAEFVAQFMSLGDRCLFPPCY